MVHLPKKTFVSFVSILFFIFPFVAAHGEEVELHPLQEWSIIVTILGVVFILFLAFLFIVDRHRLSHSLKKKYFFLIAIPVILVTIFLVSVSVYLANTSETNGPVHWHADFEIWACGERIDLAPPEGMLNRVGSPLFHEHNDNRLHVEGIVSDYEDVALPEFFEFIGGNLTESTLTVPTNTIQKTFTNGDLCYGKPSTLQVFVYTTHEDGEITQDKLQHFDYVVSPYQNVPPGDCIIIEFEEEKNMTNHLCASYEIALEKGELHGG